MLIAHALIPKIVIGLDRLAIFVAPLTGAYIAQSQTNAAGNLPAWLDGTIAGVSILALLYAVRLLFTKYDEQHAETLAARNERIDELTRDIHEVRDELEAQRRLTEEQRQLTEALRLELETTRTRLTPGEQE